MVLLELLGHIVLIKPGFDPFALATFHDPLLSAIDTGHYIRSTGYKISHTIDSIDMWGLGESGELAIWDREFRISDLELGDWVIK
jgi:hypothetical protein